MDANGTKFHLLKGWADWSQCRDAPDILRPAVPQAKAATEWDGQRQAVRLRARPTLFRTPKSRPVALSQRRGADRDAYGSTYWISDDKREIWWIPAAESDPKRFWAQNTAEDDEMEGFQPVTTPDPVWFELSGLAVNSEHFLVVGYRGVPPNADTGLLIFDLHKGGTPTRQIFPNGFLFAPFDGLDATKGHVWMSADEEGNVWILDRDTKRYCGVDSKFHLMGKQKPDAKPAEDQGDFVPSDGSELPKSKSVPSADALEAFAIDELSAVSIEAVGNGVVLILNSPGLEDASENPAVSTVVRYRYGVPLGGATELRAEREIVIEGKAATDKGGADNPLPTFDVIGYDMGWTTGAEGNFLAVVEQDGKQLISFAVTGDVRDPAARLMFQAQMDYLPLLSFGGMGLIRRDNTLFYDISSGTARDDQTRWTPVQTIEQPHFGTQATLYTPVFDGKIQDCVWHRLMLDGCIPPEAHIQVEARAANSLEILDAVPFAPMTCYRRGRGAEIPFYRPFCRKDEGSDFGTWEGVFYEEKGQFLQLKLTLTGNGRVTPYLHHLRAYYPRFSYPKHYLPGIYAEERDSLGFLERFLANPEGFYTEIEDKIENVRALYDARSAPQEALDWLAGWYGLVMDPLWQNRQDQRTRFGASLYNGDSRLPPAAVDDCGGSDRRRLLIRFAPHLYERRGTLDGLRFALHLLLNPCLEETLGYLEQIAVLTPEQRKPENRKALPPAVARLLRDLNVMEQRSGREASSTDKEEEPALNAVGQNLPTPTTSAREYEELLYQWVISEIRASPIRIVERFRTRDGRAGVEGDVSQSMASSSSSSEPFAAAAHRFTVLIPNSVEPEIEAMVRRVIQLEKPAHTQFELRGYWGGFRIGEARLGRETVLGRTPEFETVLLGRSVIPTGYLSARSPMDTPNRVIADRDRVNDMPALRT